MMLSLAAAKFVSLLTIAPFALRTQPPMPVEGFGPSDSRNKLIGSPCRDLPLASNHLRLVDDPSNTRQKPSNDVEMRTARIAAYDKRKVASTRRFVRWLRDSYPSEDMSKTRLLARYYEFVELEDAKPVTERQLLNVIKDYGVETDRPTATLVDGRQKRPTVYRVRAVQQRRAS